MLKTPSLIIAVQLSGKKLGRSPGGPGFESPQSETIPVSILTSVCPCQIRILRVYGTDYRSLLEFLSQALYYRAL